MEESNVFKIKDDDDDDDDDDDEDGTGTPSDDDDYVHQGMTVKLWLISGIGMREDVSGGKTCTRSLLC